MDLINIKKRSDGTQVVSARELHSFLESKRDFSNWIKNRIEKYRFIENQDFEVFNNFGENPQGGRPLIEYALTIDTAKEISMVEGNEYLVLTDDEADKAEDEYLDNYIDECVLNELPEQYRDYFDRKAFKSDCRNDGRGHSLATYDGSENKEGEFYIYQVN